MAIKAIREAGYEIALNKLPRSLGPLIFIFTGRGNVSQGAQELFHHLPYEYVECKNLPEIAAKGRKFLNASAKNLEFLPRIKS